MELQHLTRQDIARMVVKCCYNDAGEEKLITQGILYNHTLWFGLLKMSINNDYMFKHHVTEENIFSTTIIERERLPAAIRAHFLCHQTVCQEVSLSNPRAHS